MKKGAPWELQNERWLEALAEAGLAWGVRCHPEVKVVRTRVIFSGKGPPDFMGLTHTGQAFAFDCKHEATLRFYFHMVPLHQAEALDRVLALGGLAFISAELAGGRVAIPWARLRPLWWAWHRGQPGPASVKGSDPMCLPLSEEGWWVHRHLLGKEPT